MLLLHPFVLNVYAALYNFTLEEAYVDASDPSGGERASIAGRPHILDGLSTDMQFLTRMNLINNMFPGPAIELVEDETLKVVFENKIYNEYTDIHWHGFHQRSNSHHDGAYRLNTCGVAPREKRTYEMVAAPCGSRFYHGHSANHFIQGLVGPIIIHCRDDPYTTSYIE